MSTNLTPVQKQALIAIAKLDDQRTISDRTLAALDSRGLVTLDLDAYVVTDSGIDYLKRVGEWEHIERYLGVATHEPTDEPKAPAKPKAKSKTAKAREQFEEDQAARKAKEAATEEPAKPEAPHGTTRITRTDTPKAGKDDTIRVSAQILAWLEPHGQMRVALLEKLDAATVAKDGSKRIDVTDADLDELSQNAEAMAKAGVSRGEVRSAKALVQWIHGMKARRASRKA